LAGSESINLFEISNSIKMEYLRGKFDFNCFLPQLFKTRGKSVTLEMKNVSWRFSLPLRTDPSQRHNVD